MLPTQRENPDNQCVSASRDSLPLHALQGNRSALSNERRPPQRIIQRLQLTPALLEDAKSVPLDQSQLPEISLQPREIIVEAMLPGTLQKPLRLIEGFVQRPVHPHHLYNRI